MTKFVKGLLLMAGVILTALQSSVPPVWAVTIITTVCVGIGYYVKNYYIPSTSVQGELNWGDILSGMILAIVAGVSNSLSELVISGIVVWGALFKIIGTVSITYLTTTFFSGTKVN